MSSAEPVADMSMTGDPESGADVWPVNAAAVQCMCVRRQYEERRISTPRIHNSPHSHVIQPALSPVLRRCERCDSLPGPSNSVGGVTGAARSSRRDRTTAENSTSYQSSIYRLK